MNEYLALEIMTEVAWQLGDSFKDIPRAESRWKTVDIAKKIIATEGLINRDTTDIDEIVAEYLMKEETK